jgi:TupA-like ATPgrasp
MNMAASPAGVTHRTRFDDLLEKALPRLRRHLPYNRFGDTLYHRLLFFKKHRRWPGNQLLWNDVWYRIKTGKEILDPLRVFVSDKEHVKQYVRDTVGEQHNVPTLAVLRSPAEVDAYQFPARCCIKPTQASAQVVLRLAGEPIDYLRIKSWFDINYYYAGREINYRQLQPKVIVEPLIFDNPNVDDFKVFCWKGVPKFVQQDFDRHTNHTRKIFDTDWNEQDFSIIYPRATAAAPRPKTLAKMLELARALSAPFSFIRVDLYSDNEQVLVGEITNCSANAGGFFLPRSAEKKASQLMFG